MKEIISTKNAPKAMGPYSQAVRANGFLFLSGQAALDPQTGKLAGESIQEQTKQTIENLKAVLEAAGASLADVVKTSVFLKDIGDFAQMNETYAAYFGANPPARTTIEAARLPLDVRVEIDAIALVGK